MIAEMIALIVKFIMNNHIYVFNGEVYLQENEGSIGIRLTGVLADIVMILWCQKFASKLKDIGVENDLLTRFVDDITILPTVIKPGIRLVEDKLVYKEEFCR